MKVFDITNDYKPVASVIDHEKAVFSADFANTSNKIVFGSGDGFNYVMNLSKNWFFYKYCYFFIFFC